jgi:hypothetical protein
MEPRLVPYRRRAAFAEWFWPGVAGVVVGAALVLLFFIL